MLRFEQLWIVDYFIMLHTLVDGFLLNKVSVVNVDFTWTNKFHIIQQLTYTIIYIIHRMLIIE
jgi:hypothetical protein